MLYSVPIIVRIGKVDVNWSNTSDVNIWGLPQAVPDTTVRRINRLITRHGGVVVWFLAPSYKKTEGRFVAVCILQRHIHLDEPIK